MKANSEEAKQWLNEMGIPMDNHGCYDLKDLEPKPDYVGAVVIGLVFAIGLWIAATGWILIAGVD